MKNGLFSSTLVRKFVMAITGLFLCLFLIVHLIGNSLLYFGPGLFNSYAEKMSSNIFIRALEIILALGFLLHIGDGLVLMAQARKARSVGYLVNKSRENSSLAARIINISAILVLIFLVIHIRTFWVSTHFGNTTLSMYDLVLESFRSGPYSAFYVISMIFLFFHLYHGFQSAFQSLGFYHAKFTPWIMGFGRVFAILMAIGFSSFPIYFYLVQS